MVMGWIRSVAFTLALAYLAKFIYLFLVGLGVGVHHNNVHPGKCRVIPGITCGSEAISVAVDGLAFITSGFRDLTRCNPNFIRGRLYLFDFNKPNDNVTELKIIGGKLNLDSFVPHGMDIYELPDEGRIHVYVVNHADHVESVEVFVYDRKNPHEIVHSSTITDEKFVCINDIAVVDKEHFYVTNLHQYCKIGKIMMQIEYFLHMKTANVVYYKHGHTVIAAKGIFLNGITLSKSKKEVLVVHGNKDVNIYDRDHTNGQLTFKKSVFLGFTGDNIFVDKQTGHFYVAYFKNVMGLLQVSANRSDYCGSSGAMLSVASEAMDNIDVKEMFHDNGESFVCGATQFVHYKGQYLLGTVFDKLGYCRKE